MIKTEEKKRLVGIDTVIWDLDWTLWGHENLRELEILCRHFNIPCDDEIKLEFQELLENYGTFLNCKKVSNASMAKACEYYMPILHVYNVSGESFLKKWNENNLQYEIEGASEVLNTLAQKGYKQIAFSDWLWEVQIVALKKFEFLKYFEKVFTGDGSYMKPDIRGIERIFENCNKSGCIFIGDSLSKDIGISNATGIQSIWFNWRKEPRSKCPNVVPTYEVTSMLEILDIL